MWKNFRVTFSNKQSFGYHNPLLCLFIHSVPLKQMKDTFHGTCNVVSGKTADRKKTGQSRIKPDNMQLAL